MSPQTASVYISRQTLGIGAKTIRSVTVHGVGRSRQVELKGGTAELKFEPRELLVVEVAGAQIEIAAHRMPPAPAPGDIPTEVEIRAGEITVKAAAIAVAPGPWDAFIWCTAGEEQAASVTLETHVNSSWKSQTDTDYPFEFNVSMASSEEPLRFRVLWESPSGEKFRSENLMTGAAKSGRETNKRPQKRLWSLLHQTPTSPVPKSFVLT
jgi:hypothetical protein